MIWQLSCLAASDDEEVLEQRSDPGNTITQSCIEIIYHNGVRPSYHCCYALYVHCTYSIFFNLFWGTLRKTIGVIVISVNCQNFCVYILKETFMNYLNLWSACRKFMFDFKMPKAIRKLALEFLYTYCFSFCILFSFYKVEMYTRTFSWYIKLFLMAFNFILLRALYIFLLKSKVANNWNNLILVFVHGPFLAVIKM